MIYIIYMFFTIAIIIFSYLEFKKYYGDN